MKAKRVPSANEFSPGIIVLKDTLTLVDQNAGSRKEIVNALRMRYFSKHALKHEGKRRLTEQSKLANNVLIGLGSYGLFDMSENKLTEQGMHILNQATDETAEVELAKHVLKNLNGVELLLVLRDMRDRGDRVNKESIARELNSNGFEKASGGPLPLSTTDHTKMLQWLRQCGIIEDSQGYPINEAKLNQVLGVSKGQLSDIEVLNDPQRAFLKTLRHMAESSGTIPIPTKQVCKLCVLQHGRVFDGLTDKLSAKVYKPLEKAGWLKRSKQGSGRGSHSGSVSATKKLLALDPDLFGLGELNLIPAEIKPYLRKPLQQLHKDLGSSDTYEKGLALEALALKIMLDVGLRFSRFRERSSATNGAEVDLICDGIHLHYSRWLIQCKNTKTTSLKHLAKEVGNAIFLKANVILFVTTGRIPATIVEHAKGLASSTHLQAVLVDGAVLTEYFENGISSLIKHFQTSAQEVMRLKAIQLGDSDTDA